MAVGVDAASQGIDDRCGRARSRRVGTDIHVFEERFLSRVPEFPEELADEIAE